MRTGITAFKLTCMLKELFCATATFFLFFAVLAFFIHVLAPNKYVGYFIFIAFLIANVLGLAAVERRDEPGAIWGPPDGDLFGLLSATRRSATAWDWFTRLLAVLLRTAGSGVHRILATRQAEHVARALAKRGTEIPRGSAPSPQRVYW